MGHYYQKVLTENVSPWLARMGIAGLTRPFYSGRGQILMLHRIIPLTVRPRIHNHLSLEVSPENLERIIGYFKRHDYDFISMDQLPDWLQINKNNQKKFVIFTFDDGYADNYTFAYPVFVKYEIPFTIYITTALPEKKAIFWWYVLEEIILGNDHVDFSYAGSEIRFNCQTHKKKENSFNQIRSIITSFSEETLSESLTFFFEKYGFNIHSFNDTLSINWDQVRQLSLDKLVTIGCHTVNHYNLTRLSDENSFFEMAESKHIIEGKTDKEVLHFSYPLGKYGNREVEYAKKCGFATATTTKTANTFCEHSEHLYTLPRIQVNSLSTENVLDLHRGGFFQAILNGFRRVVV
jgi:peptidoglycan/xylan/chitin deacetylase (PgdA/CDA1 family)